MFEKSKSLYEKAVQLMPGGVSSPVRAFRSVGGTPIYMDRGEGAHVVDVDGNRYLDFCCSWGPLILGHGHPAVKEAIIKTVEKGWTFGTPVPAEVDLAQIVKDQIGLESIRFVNSGTEAVMSAVRLARGYTNRDRILKFSGCYHGHVDNLLVNAGSGLATFGTASSAGVPEAFAKLTATMPLNDREALDKLFQEHGSELACVLMEGVPANNGLLIQDREYIHHLAKLCKEHGALLIFDEVLSGFRMPEVMAAKHYEVEPDIITLGKVIGGGMPVGAYGARREIMDHVAPLGKVYQAGTLAGNPVAMAAGHATLKTYFDNDVPQYIEKIGSHLDIRMTDILENTEDMGYIRLGSLFWMYFGCKDAPKTAEDIPAVGSKIYAKLYHFMLNRGLYLAPSAYEVGFLNAAHSVADMDQLADALKDAIEQGVIR